MDQLFPVFDGLRRLLISMVFNFCRAVKADIYCNRKGNPTQLVQFRQKPNVLFV